MQAQGNTVRARIRARIRARELIELRPYLSSQSKVRRGLVTPSERRRGARICFEVYIGEDAVGSVGENTAGGIGQLNHDISLSG